MGQKLEWFVAGLAHAIRKVTMIHHRTQRVLVCYLINTALP